MAGVQLINLCGMDYIYTVHLLGNTQNTHTSSFTDGLKDFTWVDDVLVFLRSHMFSRPPPISEKGLFLEELY